MGHEFKIRVAEEAMDKARADECLRFVPGFTKFDEDRSFYIFREPTNLGEMPNVVVKLESDGFYVCDFGSSQLVMPEISRVLSAHFGEIRLEDYEP